MSSFYQLPTHEKQAFFSLLDEYFASRPHLLPGRSAQQPASSSSTAASRTSSRSDVAGAQAGVAAMSVNHGKSSSAASHGHKGQAEVLYDFRGAESDDLSVRRYDIIDLVERVSDDWWRAKTTDGTNRTGIVPANYIKVI